MEDDIFGGGKTEQAPVDTTKTETGAGDGAGEGADKGKVEDKGKTDAGAGAGADNIEEHPKFKELHSKLSSMGGNLSGQNKIINNLKKEIENLKGGKGAGEGSSEANGGELFKEIKTSKDLTKEEKDEMTESEIKQFDEIATLKQGMNQLAKLIGSGKVGKDGDGSGEGDGTGDDDLFIETGDTSPVEDFKAETKAVALKLAGNDVDMANKIINEFNQFAGNETLNKAQLQERLAKSAKLVEGYKPIKEQATKRGSTVGGGKDDKDPFGVNAIVESAGKKNDGNYTL